MFSWFYDYFHKCDAVELNFRILIACGFWPADVKKKWHQVVYSIYSLVCFTSLVHIFMLEALDIYLVRDDMKKVAWNLCSTSAAFMCISKQFILLARIEKIQTVYEKLKRFKSSRTDPLELERLDQADEVTARATKMTYILGVPCISIWMLFPLVDFQLRTQRQLPYPYRLPTDDWSTPAYEIVYVYESMSMIGYLVSIMSNDLVYLGMVSRINAEYDILFDKLRSLEGIVDSKGGEEEDTVHDASVTERAKLRVKECAAFHQNILSKIQELKVIYNDTYLLHFIGSTLLVGSIILDAIVNHELSRAIYSTPWYRLNPKVRKDLLMILVRSKKTSVVRIGNMIPLSLETFLDFLKLSYNISTLMYQTVE